MLQLSIEEIIKKIESEETFNAIAFDNSFSIKIESYVPYVCGAIHDGHQFRDELIDNCIHTEYERWYEEDPSTKQMIQSHPIVIAGMDSRFEYDLNRSPETAIYTDAWGKQLWHNPLSEKVKQKSLQKHHNFYKVVNSLIKKIEKKFGISIVFDMHSYNWKRWDREVPTWNLGTTNIDNSRFEIIIEQWRQSLSEIKLPNKIKSTSKINDTFQGNGYFLKYITSNFKNSLVLATEVSKIYCNELDGTIYNNVVNKIEEELKIRLSEQASVFYELYKK
ncbi:hypothetical protein D7030_03105 [Flavobacteriaceae bacterium AU392]|nr:hypothetical protein D1817_09580 [Flavobacteriaceae bacterium]RKM85674.1 hypothetical protein D7030_03105 [Flavobacteriaceae bacterium AU392]